jgi:hypothetical protein
MATFLLVHAPLLGPGSWRPCAAVLEAAGHSAIVPDFRPQTEPADGWWHRAADTCARAAGDADVVIVGHSGAGVLLPLVASRCTTSAVVFVDAITPASSGGTASSERIREFVAALPHENGLLPRWSTWWGEEAIAEILPDPEMRATLAADESRLPLDFYDYAVPVPAGWEPSTVAYVQLSEPYDEDAAEAARRGWTVSHLTGAHLDPLTRPEVVVSAVLTSVKA